MRDKRHNEPNLASLNLSTAHATCFGHMARMIWPTTRGTNTESPICFMTLRYMAGRLCVASAGSHSLNAPTAGRYSLVISSGLRNGPMKLPTVTETMVAATSPLPWRVMTTLLLIVVGKHPVATNPTSVLVAMVPPVLAAAAIPKHTAEVTRNDVIWTMMCRRILRACRTSWSNGSERPETRKMRMTAP